MNVSTYAYLCMYLCVYMPVSVCVYVCMSVCRYVYMSVCLSVCMWGIAFQTKKARTPVPQQLPAPV